MIPADSKVKLWSHLSGWLPEYLGRPEKSYSEMARHLAASLEADLIATWRQPVHGIDNPGVVDGDLLVELLAELVPAEWTTEAARGHAEQVLAGMYRSGVLVLRGPTSQPWTPPAVDQAAPPVAPPAGLPASLNTTDHASVDAPAEARDSERNPR